jgi:hypothetical protein
MASKSKRKSHTQKWRLLSKIPGLESELRGKYHKTRSNVAKINSMFRKLEYQTKHPDKFVTLRPRSDKSKRSLKGNPHVGKSFVVPKLGFTTVRLDRGRVLRSRTKEAGRENLIIYAREVVGPGSNIVDRIRALSSSRYRVGRGRFMVQIGDRAPFQLAGMQGPGNLPEIAAAKIEQYVWQDKRGLDFLQHYMHLVWYERKDTSVIDFEEHDDGNQEEYEQ